MVTGKLGGSLVEDVVDTINSLIFLNDFKFGLTDESRDEVHSHAQFLEGSQSTQIDQNLKVVTLEIPHEVFSVDAGQHLFLSHFLLTVLSSLLQHSAVLLFILA